MRIGLIGLGRIGAFHADTLVGIPASESLVVTDTVPDRTKQVVDRHQAQGVEGVDSVDWIAEACARSLREHRPVRIEEVRIA